MVKDDSSFISGQPNPNYTLGICASNDVIGAEQDSINKGNL